MTGKMTANYKRKETDTLQKRRQKKKTRIHLK